MFQFACLTTYCSLALLSSVQCHIMENTVIHNTLLWTNKFLRTSWSWKVCSGRWYQVAPSVGVVEGCSTSEEPHTGSCGRRTYPGDMGAQQGVVCRWIAGFAYVWGTPAGCGGTLDLVQTMTCILTGASYIVCDTQLEANVDHEVRELCDQTSWSV